MTESPRPQLARSTVGHYRVAISAGLIGLALLALAAWLSGTTETTVDGMQIEAEVVEKNDRGSSTEVVYTYTFDGVPYCSGEFVTGYEDGSEVRRCEGGVRVSETAAREISLVRPMPIVVDPDNPAQSRPVEPPYSTTWMILLGLVMLAVAAQQVLAARSGQRNS